MDSVFKIIAELDDKASPGLQQLSGTLGDIGKGLVAGAIATGLTMVVNKFAEAVQKTIDFGDELGKLSQKTGIATDELSGLAYAGDLAGVSLQGLANGYRKLAQSMFEAKDGTSEQAEYFRMLGIEVEDANGKLKSTEEIMYQLADVFKEMEDGPEKTAIAMKLLGKAGADMIPFLNQGSEAIKAFKEETKEFGAFWDSDNAKKAEQFNDNITRLQQAVTGLFTEIAQRLLPILISLTDALIQSAKEGGTLNAVFTAMKVVGAALYYTVFVPLTQAVSALSTAFNVLGKIIGGVFAATAAAISGDFKGAVNILTEMTNDVGKAIKEQIDFSKSLFTMGKTAKESGEDVKGLSGNLNDLTINTKQAKDETIDFINKLQQEYEKIGMTDVQKKLYDYDLELKKKVAAGKASEEYRQIMLAEARAILENGEARQKNVDDINKRIETIRKENEEAIKFEAGVRQQNQNLTDEISLMGLSNEERRIKLELKRLERELDSKGTPKDVKEQLLAEREANIRQLSEQQQLEQLLSDTTEARIAKSREAMVLLTKALEEGKISQEQYLEAVEQGLDRLGVKAKKTSDEMTEFFKSAAQGIQQSMSSFLFDFMQGKLTDLSSSIKRVIDKMVADMLAAQAATLLFGADFGKSGSSGNIGGLVGSLFSGIGSIFGRAGGGDVSAGRPYIVGEKRPELFVPRSNGTIIPSLDGMGTNVNINISAMDGTDVMRVLSRSKREIAEMITTTNRSYNLRGS